MKINGTRKRMVSLASDERVPVELRIGQDRIDVWLDHRGIHFRQSGGGAGDLPWDVALAMSLVPPDRRPRGPAA